METWLIVFNGVTTVLIAIGSFLLSTTKKSVETLAEKQAEELSAQINFPFVLARELKKTMSVERHESRVKSYGALWAKMSPLAIYTEHALDAKAVKHLSDSLTSWYFSAEGGLFLTGAIRDFYFSLQDLLVIVSRETPDLPIERFFDGHRDEFVNLCKEKELTATVAIAELSRLDHPGWQQAAAPYGDAWKKEVKALAKMWPSISSRQRFAVLQQVGSILRSALATDIESRTGSDINPLEPANPNSALQTRRQRAGATMLEGK